jgi:DNA-binding response OmpR family regulator
MKKILLADDDRHLRRLVSATLEGDPKYVILQASNGQETLELARREHPDLILLDVSMPQLNGFEVCRQLRADPRTSDIPVVMLTAAGNAADREEGREAGAMDYFVKPFSPLSLLRRVGELLGEESDLPPLDRRANGPGASPSSSSSLGLRVELA